MSNGKLNSHGKSTVMSLQQENGYTDSLSVLDSEKITQELLLQPSAKGVDDHLVEFSEALRTVAKALRRVAEGKASAQAEAADWKRKYELERARNLHQEHKDCDSEVKRTRNMCNKSSQSLADEQSEKCCGKHGICSHEVLRDGETDSNSRVVHNRMRRKASFRLSWGSNGSGQHKHDIVSFEKGNITTAERSSKQISLKWESQPQTVLILTKPNSTSVRILCAEMMEYCGDDRIVFQKVYTETVANVGTSMIDHFKAIILGPIRPQIFHQKWLKDQKKIDIFVEPRVRTELLTESPYFNFVQSWEVDEEIQLLHTKVDIVVTLGGDGTVLWAASMFKGPVPPIVPFSLGSLGFMTPFQSEHFRECLSSVLRGPISITLRHRLQCHVIKDNAKDELDTEEPILVLNEVTIDRGISSYLTNLECYCDSSFVTSVQGDGLILSTTSGSTAYSLAAGGSMVHPQVPGILFTPICPHSLSFRPLILPEYVTLRVQVPFNSRGHAWASFDGKDRKKLEAGDALVCSMAPWPVPTACQVDSTNDFLRSIHEGLHWNVRKTQSFDGPRES